MTVRRLIIVLCLWLLAAAQHVWFAPLLQRLPTDYAETTRFDAKTQSREAPNGAWVHSRLTARRTDQTLVSSATHSIIQGDVHWTNRAGVVEFENTGIYGVDRFSRQNLPGYGDVARTGPFLFPPHMDKNTYLYWDPQFIGSRRASFDHADMIAGIAVSAFRFEAKNLDETAGYAHLPNVPERYRVHTEASGTLWIEPDSGTLVDYEEAGTSYFVDAVTDRRLTELYIWNARFTPETRAAKLAQARDAATTMVLLEYALPAGLAIAGVLIVLMGMLRRQPALASSAAMATLPAGGVR